MQREMFLFDGVLTRDLQIFLAADALCLGH
jgi:hypothetical protein